MDSASLLTLVLLGQPDRAHKLRFAPFEALSQRIAVRYHLNPFDLQETAAYVQHHLIVAGRQESVFSDSFFALVHNHTKRVARKINNLCRTALLLGVTEQKTSSTKPTSSASSAISKDRFVDGSHHLTQRPARASFRLPFDSFILANRPSNNLAGDSN